ncbi:MAG: RES family NAD+ phosphorylase [Verrucomicrobiia bacterium]
MPSAWRLVKEKHVATAFSGEGASKAGGRWNSRGVAVVYTSESESLAALETLVHIGTGSTIRFSIIRLDFDKAMVETLAPSALPQNWKSEPPAPGTKQLGDAWVRGARSAILAVPSVIIPSGLNYVLNPAHPDFSKIVFGKPKPFAFDPRLLP